MAKGFTAIQAVSDFASGDVAQLGEHCLCKAGVAGSTPVVSIGRRVGVGKPAPVRGSEPQGQASQGLVGFREEAGGRQPIHCGPINSRLLTRCREAEPDEFRKKLKKRPK